MQNPYRTLLNMCACLWFFSRETLQCLLFSCYYEIYLTYKALLRNQLTGNIVVFIDS